jgi:hypothetical protein
MNPTVADYESLARAYCQAVYGNEDDWNDECLDDDNSCVSATRDTLDMFREAARTTWREAFDRQDLSETAIYWCSVQAVKGDRRESLTVVDCGGFRLCYQV